MDELTVLELGSGQVRVTAEGRASVFDLIRAACGVGQPKVTWRRLSVNYPEVVAICNHLQFPGAGQRPTPTVDADGWVRLSMLLPGHKAAKWRAQYADLVTRYLRGDRTLAQEVVERAEVIERQGQRQPSKGGRPAVYGPREPIQSRLSPKEKAELARLSAECGLPVSEMVASFVRDGIEGRRGAGGQGFAHLVSLQSATAETLHRLVALVGALAKNAPRALPAPPAPKPRRFKDQWMVHVCSELEIEIAEFMERARRVGARPHEMWSATWIEGGKETRVAADLVRRIHELSVLLKKSIG